MYFRGCNSRRKTLSKKWAFLPVWRVKTAERDFWQKTGAFIILAPLRNDFILRFKLNGVCPKDFSMRKNDRQAEACARGRLRRKEGGGTQPAASTRLD